MLEGTSMRTIACAGFCVQGMACNLLGGGGGGGEGGGGRGGGGGGRALAQLFVTVYRSG